jgi:hypothetical protein
VLCFFYARDASVAKIEDLQAEALLIKDDGVREFFKKGSSSPDALARLAWGPGVVRPSTRCAGLCAAAFPSRAGRFVFAELPFSAGSRSGWFLGRLPVAGSIAAFGSKGGRRGQQQFGPHNVFH